MNALSAVFSDNGNVNFLLCQWHMNKNIFARQRRTFASTAAFKVLEQHWNSLVRSKTEIAYDENLTKMQEIFPHHVMAYLEETWLAYKDRFVAIFIRNKLHFGHTIASRVESTHAAVKSWITVSTGDLLTVETACQLACNNQLATIRLQTDRGPASTSLSYGLIFATVTGKVSFAALKIAYQQQKLQLSTSLETDEGNDVECHGLFTSNMGMPCRHKFRQAAAATSAKPPRVLSLDDFDSHWWLVQPSRQEAVSVAPTSIEERLKRIQEESEEGISYQRRVILDHLDALPAAEVFNPSIQHGRGRPFGAHGYQSRSSTQRDPSQFEAVKNSLRPLRRCGNCGEVGHYKRSCRHLHPTTRTITASVPQVVTAPETGTGRYLNTLGAEDEWEHFRYPPNVNE